MRPLLGGTALVLATAVAAAGFVGLRHGLAVSVGRATAAQATSAPTEDVTSPSDAGLPSPSLDATLPPDTPPLPVATLAPKATPTPTAAPTPVPTPIPHCTSADYQLTVSAKLQDSAVRIDMDFTEISDRLCSLPQSCNVIYEVYDASGNEVADDHSMSCGSPQWYVQSRYVNHAAMWGTCHPAGTYRIHAAWTSDWQGTATYVAQNEEPAGCATPAPSPSPPATPSPSPAA